MLAKINALTSSKLVNLTALARYNLFIIFISNLVFRKIALVAVLVMIILVQTQRLLQM